MRPQGAQNLVYVIYSLPDLGVQVSVIVSLCNFLAPGQSRP